MWRFSCVFILGYVSEICTGRDLPPYFPRCYIDDENINECLLNATRILKPQIRNGIEEIKLPSFNPLRISSFSIGINNGENFVFDLSLTNFSAWGLDNYEFEELNYNPETFVLNGKIKFGNIYYASHYKTVGYLFFFPSSGEGPIDARIDSVNGTFEVRGELITRNATQRYRPTNAKVEMKITGYHIRAKGVFADIPGLGDLIVQLFNMNGQTIIDASTPALERLTEGILMKFVTTLTRLVPYKKLFPQLQTELNDF